MSHTSLPLHTQQFLEGFPADIRSVVRSLRGLILEQAPETVEKLKTGWGSLVYHYPVSGYNCGLFPDPEKVKIVFEFGALLADPENLEEGETKQVRWVTLQPGDPLPEGPLRGLIQAALALPARRAEQIAMLRNGARPQSGSRDD